MNVSGLLKHKGHFKEVSLDDLIMRLFIREVVKRIK